MTATQAFTTRLTSLEELGAMFGIDPEADVGEEVGIREEAAPECATLAGASTTDEEPGRIDDGAPPTLAALLAELDAAGAALAAITGRDRSAKESALGELARHDALVSARREAEEAHARAQFTRVEAEALVSEAFTEEARAAAADIARLAMRAERAAAHAAEERRVAAEAVAARIDVGRLLAERRKGEEDAAAKAKAAAAERAGRLTSAIASIMQAIDAGSFEEASALLGTATNEFPDNAEIASLNATIARRARAVKVDAAEDALWAARREDRRDPAAAVARLEALDVEGLPQPLASQVFGEWARACARLCHDRGIPDPLRLAPHAGRGAILAPRAEGTGYVVVSALGMGPGWRPGVVIDPRQARAARPLRGR